MLGSVGSCMRLGDVIWELLGIQWTSVGLSNKSGRQAPLRAAQVELASWQERSRPDNGRDLRPL